MSWHWRIIKSSPSREWKGIPEQQVQRPCKHKREQPVAIQFREREEEGRPWRGGWGWMWGAAAKAAKGSALWSRRASGLPHHKERDGEERLHDTDGKPRWQLWDVRKEHCTEEKGPSGDP